MKFNIEKTYNIDEKETGFVAGCKLTDGIWISYNKYEESVWVELRLYGRAVFKVYCATRLAAKNKASRLVSTVLEGKIKDTLYAFRLEGNLYIVNILTKSFVQTTAEEIHNVMRHCNENNWA